MKFRRAVVNSTGSPAEIYHVYSGYIPGGTGTPSNLLYHSMVNIGKTANNGGHRFMSIVPFKDLCVSCSCHSDLKYHIVKNSGHKECVKIVMDFFKVL